MKLSAPLSVLLSAATFMNAPGATAFRPDVQINMYSDEGCGNYVTSIYTSKSQSGQCKPTGWAGIHGIRVADFPADFTFGICLLFESENCTGHATTVGPEGPSSKPHTSKCKSSAPGDIFRSYFCSWP
ncbi:hypothetical protein NM208_g2578 [Fusarium decemcellulare]|uniref:Uncharacterized protein n=1 Tax=Fusarium decemcellulare TaxID=57161 RepID=A0ACC1SRY5_9HYPO|nr:hypothetical protein NM208_g2578 [Fusarium decemcellulare]